jgi:UDP-N-acetylmuramoyl-L-alanyl-D-glutamate--2,6-diaminopimelate ligase
VTVLSAGLLEALRSAGLLREIRGELPASFPAISDDTRKMERGSLFVAVRGAERDGHDFLPQAEAGGATAAIVEDAGRTSLPAIIVNNGRLAAATAASAAFDWPARQLRLIGVTGTNGKTTTVTIIRHLLDEPQSPAASVGTLGVMLGPERALPGGEGLTTPGPIELQRLLRQLVDLGIKTVAMEVSSHSLDQHRVDGVTFDAAVFTNLTRDHLDYHRTMDAYFSAKAKLLSRLSDGGTAVMNADATEWRALRVAGKTVTYGMKEQADVMASQLSHFSGGSKWNLVARGETVPVTLPLLGSVNVYNALAAASAAIALGRDIAECANRLSTLPQIPGRLERISLEPLVLRDYAHTPDALERMLKSARQLKRDGGRMILVFGCGGGRDRGKRPIMGQIAERLADIAIVTSDNPRREDPDSIIDEIEAGMTGKSHERVTDRRRAIRRALELAGKNDVVILAGKGHETYQIRGDKSYPFDEREIVQEIRSGVRG